MKKRQIFMDKLLNIRNKQNCNVSVLVCLPEKRK